MNLIHTKEKKQNKNKKKKKMMGKMENWEIKLM